MILFSNQFFNYYIFFAFIEVVADLLVVVVFFTLISVVMGSVTIGCEQVLLVSFQLKK
jgi:hypothetical protein